jgi:predicted TIM-barrel fold metal-dependent hydrolase
MATRARWCRSTDRFIGCFVYNPRCGVENGVNAIERYVKRMASRWCRCRPTCMPIGPTARWTGCARLSEMRRAGVPVKLHTGDGPYSIPSEWMPMIQEFPNVNFIMAHFGVQTGGVYCFEPFQMAMDLPNVYCESGWCLQSRIVEFAKVLPKHKILFGTDTPPNEPGMWLRLLEVLCTNRRRA